MSNIQYYNENAQTFFDGTIELDMHNQYSRFTKFLPTSASILDAGCGSGRDTFNFGEMGYAVEAFDASPELAKLASEYTGQEVNVCTFQTYQSNRQYDGIWCCASLLHVPEAELRNAIVNMRDHLVPYGHMYLSFREGEAETKENGRTFTNMTLDRLKEHIYFTGLEIVDAWTSDDVRPDRTHTWLNVIVQYVPIFQLTSDHHTEFCEDNIFIHPYAEHINLLIAGDFGTISAKNRYTRLISKVCEQYKTVTLVAGNHEFYGYNIRGSYEFLRELEDTLDNFTFLNKNFVKVDGVYVIGCTLWTDLMNDPANLRVISDTINDYRKIRHGSYDTPYSNKLTIMDTMEFNYEQRNYIFATHKAIRDNDPLAKTIILTHHAPLFESVSTKDIDAKLNAAYMNDYSEFIKLNSPSYWCHGHIHDYKLYKFCDTMVYCNPLGYVSYNKSENTGCILTETFTIPDIHVDTHEERVA